MEYMDCSSTLSGEDLLLSFIALAELSDDGVLIVDAQGRIAYINTAYCDYLGLDKQIVMGQPVLNYIESSQLVKIANDPNFKKEINVFHKTSTQQFTDRECYAIVNRAHVNKGGVPLSGVGQIKFVRSTIKLSNALNEVYTQLEYYKNQLGIGRCSFENIVGTSHLLEKTKQVARRAAVNDFSVLILGETGTGKEVFANAIHYSSHRKTKPFIRINCAAIPAELLESELFGYAEGSFTGAKKGGKKGKFELANGGTIFLDEIGEMPLVMQAKILRALQEREIEPVGGDRPVPVDIRVIAATNKDLLKEVAEKRFRKDLYYRLNVIEIRLPPLRERPEDIAEYVNTFLAEVNQKYHTSTAIAPEAVAVLSRYRWPGNVRELRNTVERCYALSEDGLITRFMIPRNISGDVNYSDLVDRTGSSLETIVEEVERRMILEELKHTSGNCKKAAENLKIHRTTLYKKMEKYHISRDSIPPME